MTKKSKEKPAATQAVEVRSIDAVKPYEKNPRQNDAAVAAVATSIAEYGFRNPILVDGDGVIICGHTRLKAAHALGLTEVPVIVAGDLPPAKVKALRIADNKTAEGAEWDDGLLRVEIEELRADGADINALGFSDDELSAILDGGGTDGQTEEDAEPQVDRGDELQKKWSTERGQVWALGRHRLMCGDSTSGEDVARLLRHESADMIFTSPPYGQQRDYRDDATESVSDWDRLMDGVFSSAITSDDAQLLVNLGMVHRDGEWLPYWDKWIENMRKSGWRRFGLYVWDQGPGLPGDWAGRFAPSHELVFHFNKRSVKPNKTQECKYAGMKHEGEGGLRGKDGVVNKWSHKGALVQDHKIPDSVCRESREKSSYIVGHPAMFSVGFAQYFIGAWPGIVYEPFSGGGTTIVACENLSRECRAMEISPAYVAIALQRFQDAFDVTPEIAVDG